MMAQLRQQPAPAARLPGDDAMEERRLGQIDALATRIEAVGQLLYRRPGFGVKLYLRDAQGRAAQDNLCGTCELLPEEGGAQDVMAVDDLLQGSQVAIQQFPIREGHLHEQQVWIALAGEQVMEEDAVLKGREG